LPPTKYTVGSIWGYKKIISKAGYNKFQQPIYNWECVLCDKKGSPATGTAIARNPRSICCPPKLDEKSNYKGYKEIRGSKISSIKSRASARGLEYSVDSEYLWKIWEEQGGKCAYTGNVLKHNLNASLDRVDSTKGYVEGNLQWVDKKINRMKLNLPHEEFLEICNQIIVYSKKERG
jgi:hypothetical protein